MCHPPLLSYILTMAPSSLSLPKPTRKPSSLQNPTSPNCPSSSPTVCRHSPTVTLDILFLVLVIFAATFLIFSYLSYIFTTLPYLLPSPSSLVPLLSHLQYHHFFWFFFLFFFFSFFLVFEICVGLCSRRCRRSGCKGLRRAMEFDLKLQGEDCLRSGSESRAVKEIDQLPWKGGSETNPDYECLRAELRKMAPPNGRAVLLFRDKCGCPVAKLEGWGTKRSRRHKKNMALKGESDCA